MKNRNTERRTMVAAVWKKLGGDEGARRLLSGYSEVIVKKHLIDTDAAPHAPKGLCVSTHLGRGLLEWERAKTSLYLHRNQRLGRHVEGEVIWGQLKKRPVLNACVLDHLLAHPSLIPEAWEKDENECPRFIFFWGTLYTRADGDVRVRYLYRIGKEWQSDSYGLRDGWFGCSYAVLFSR